eukprot:1720406-Rhodomonas_salina.1
MILEHLKPAKVIIVHGSEAATQVSLCLHTVCVRAGTSACTRAVLVWCTGVHTGSSSVQRAAEFLREEGHGARQHFRAQGPASASGASGAVYAGNDIVYAGVDALYGVSALS